ncbi:unnamed protein product [Cochlearia groenlandica]
MNRPYLIVSLRDIDSIISPYLRVLRTFNLYKSGHLVESCDSQTDEIVGSVVEKPNSKRRIESEEMKLKRCVSCVHQAIEQGEQRSVGHQATELPVRG